MSSPPTHLILGSSGFLGIALARHLKLQGFRVIGIDLVEPDSVNLDLFDEFHRSAMEEFDYTCLSSITVIHHVASAVPLAGTGRSFLQKNVRANEALIKALGDIDYECFVYYSSSAVSGRDSSHGDPLSEDDTSPIEEYGESKLLAEKLFTSMLGGRLLILRPRTILGPGRRGLFGLLFRWLRENKTVILPGNAKTPYQFIHVEDLLHAMDLLISNKARGVFNVGGEVSILSEDLEMLKRKTGSTSNFLSLPDSFIPIIDFFCRIGFLPFARWQVLSFSKAHILDTTLLNKLDWKPRRSNLAALEETYLNCREENNQKGSSFHQKDLKLFSVSPFLRILRPLHWLKNLLLFVPLVFSKEIQGIDPLFAFYSLLSWCSVTSGVYCLNDLWDRQADEKHPVKKYRPLASRSLKPQTVGLLSVSLFLLGFLIAPEALHEYFLIYLGSNFLYGLGAKKIPYLDLFFLTGFYLVRIQSGFILTDASVTPWIVLAAFCFFFGLSSFKREYDLSHCFKGRGYGPQSSVVLRNLGKVSWLLLSILLCGYVLSGEALQHYRSTEWIFLSIPILWVFFYRLRWLQSNAGSTEFLEHILKDKISWGCLFGVGLIYGLASAG